MVARGVSSVVHVTLGRSLGGLPELLRGEIRALNRLGVPARWHSLEGVPEMRPSCDALHRWPHDEPALDPSVTPSSVIEALAGWAARSAREVLDRTGPDDTIVLHDPATAALCPLVAPRRQVVWRSHIGATSRSGHVQAVGTVLDHWLEHARLAMFHTARFAWDGIRLPVHEAPPGIDVDSIKNRDLTPLTARASADLLTRGRLAGRCGLLDPGGTLDVLDDDGTSFLPSPDTRYVLHVSRWDPLKGQAEGLRASLPFLADHPELHYVLVGPQVGNTMMAADNRRVREEIAAVRESAGPPLAGRIHMWRFACPQGCEQRETINRLRTGAAVVVSPSRREGFGLAVTEAMYRRAPVVASPADGHLLQLDHGRTGWLAAPGTEDWGKALAEAVDAGPETGRAARAVVQAGFTVDRSVRRQLDVIGRPARSPAGPAAEPTPEPIP